MRLAPRYDEEIMVKIAQMYYIDGSTQSMIAKQLGLSRSSVCMILSDARDYGIVEINIKNPKKYNEQLANEILSKYGNLKKCFVVPTSINSNNILTKIIASQGTNIVEEELLNHSTIGVAWGTTIYEFMHSFNNNSNLIDIQVVPLLGGTNRVSSEFQLNEMVRQFAEKLRGTPSFIYAPAYAESINDRELYMQSNSMQNIAEKWKILDAAIVSIGAMPEYYNENKLFDNKVLLNPFVIKTMFEQDSERAVGDICGRRFNINGQFLNNEHNKKLIAISEDSLAAIPKVICIAAGSHKILSIIGGLRTNTIDILVTDDYTAKSMLDISSL
jgi:DNA-binding transcriptional regulator LsrR (DeoR family)